MTDYLNFVGNYFVHELDADALTVRNPATGLPVARLACASATLAQQAVAQAAAAQKAWRKLPAIERGNSLRRLADALLGRILPIANALALETGKSMDDASAEVHYGAALLLYHAEWARRIEGEIIPSDNPGEHLYLHREPIGVVACLIPYNFPIYTLIRKAAPALIAGNAVVIRPSNTTPCSALEFAQAVLDAQLPAGLVNVLVMHHDVAGVMCTQPAVGMMTLTGSVTAGRQIMEYAKVNIARTSLELGGKTPAIIAVDADLEKAAQEVVRSRLSHCGQLCTAVERVLVEAPVHDRVLALLRKQISQRSFGPRDQNPGHMGPLSSECARQQIHALVTRALAGGATLEAGGYMPEGPGFFYPPTLLSNCRQDMEIMREEIFGPVLCVMACDSLEQALENANDHQYGLSSVLYTKSLQSAMHVSSSIEAGEIYINRTPADPYQGYHAGWKRSGIGGDDGKHGMLEFTQTRLVVLPFGGSAP